MLPDFLKFKSFSGPSAALVYLVQLSVREEH